MINGGAKRMAVGQCKNQSVMTPFLMHSLMISILKAASPNSTAHKAPAQRTSFIFGCTSISKIIEKEHHVEAKYHRRKKISNAYTYTKSEYIYDTISTTYFYDEKK